MLSSIIMLNVMVFVVPDSAFKNYYCITLLLIFQVIEICPPPPYFHSGATAPPPSPGSTPLQFHARAAPEPHIFNFAVAHTHQNVGRVPPPPPGCGRLSLLEILTLIDCPYIMGFPTTMHGRPQG